MNIQRCPNGHFYDTEKYPSCPHCSNGNPGGLDSVVLSPVAVGTPADVPAAEDVTVSYAEQRDLDATIAFNYRGAEKSENPSPVPERREIFNPVVGWLVCVQGPERGRDYKLVAGRNFIGRSVDSDICVRDDMEISRDNHASVIYDVRSAGYYILPGEQTLTRVNGEELTEAVALKDFDEIAVGSSLFRFVCFCREGDAWL